MHRPDSQWPAASTLVTAPTKEPVSVSWAKDHSNIPADLDDALLGRLIQAARTHIEEQYGWALITQVWDAFYDAFPKTTGALVLPRPPLQSVTEVEYTDSDGVATVLTATDYNVDADSFPGIIRLKYSNTWPSDILDTTTPVRVRFDAGYGDDESDVPASIRLALLVLVADMYEHRESFVTGTIVTPLPMTVRSLLEPFRPPVMA